MIQRPRQRNYPPRAHAAISRLQTHNAAKSGWLPHRSAGVAPNRAEPQPASYRRRPTTRRTTRNARDIPGIVHLPISADDRTSPKSKLVQVLFTDHHRPSLFQAAHNLGIFRRHTVFEQSARRRCPNPGCIYQIFQTNRCAVQRPAPLTMLNFLLRGPCLPQRRVRSHGNERVQ